MILYLLLVLLGLIIVLFAFPQFSPVPYFPANKKDTDLILKALRLRSHQVVIDLGAGDGIVIFKAAKEAMERGINTKFIAVEINPLLILILYVRRLMSPNRANIKIVWADMFKINLSQLSKPSNHTTIFVYISPWLMPELFENVRRSLKKFEVVSYFYPLPKLKDQRLIKTTKNIHAIYRYS